MATKKSTRSQRRNALAGNTGSIVERRRSAIVRNVSALLLSEAKKPQEGKAVVSELLQGPRIKKSLFRYVGGDYWFQHLKTKNYWNCKTKTSSKSLPAGFRKFDDDVSNLPIEVKRLEIRRRDRERKFVAKYQGDALGFLHIQLKTGNKQAIQVIKKETQQQAIRRQRMSASEQESYEKISVFDFFDCNDGGDIDKNEFLQGIRGLLDYARLTGHAENGDVKNVQALDENELTHLFKVMAGDDDQVEVHEFKNFFSTGFSTADQDVEPIAEKMRKFISYSTEYMRQRGDLDAIEGEKNFARKKLLQDAVLPHFVNT